MGWLIARLFVRTAVLRKRSLVVGILVVLELLLALDARGSTSFDTLLRELITGFMLPVIALVFGSAVVRDDLEGGTLGYFLVRPIPRGVLLGARLLTAATVVTASGLVMVAVNGVALGARNEELVRALGAVGLGALAYTAVFVALGILFRRTFLAGFMLLFGDWALGRMPMAARFISIRGHVENVAGLEPPFQQVANLLAPPPSVATSSLALVVIAGALLGFAAWRFRHFEFNGAEG